MNGDLRVGKWLVQPGLNTISQNGTSRQLEPKVMEVLVCLAHHAGETLPKEQLLKAVWPDTFVSDDVLVRSISEIRRAFEDDARESKFIQTIPKRGYRLIAAVERVNGTALATVADSVPATEPVHNKKRNLRIGILIGFAATVALLALIALMPADEWRKLRGKPDFAPIRSIAVMPLQDLSCDPSQDYFADAMTEELITELSRIKALRITSRTSIMRYKKGCGESHSQDKSLAEIARELNVEGVVEGSVLRSGDRVRITAQLIYAPKDTNLWAQTYDGDLRDVLALQSTVAAAIAREVNVEVTPQEQAQLRKTRPVNRKALDAYFEGQTHIQQSFDQAIQKPGGAMRSEEEHRKALAFFQQAIQEDPEFAPAYVALSQVWQTPWVQGTDLQKAKAAVEKAVALDDTLVQARLQMAYLLEATGQWNAAEREFTRVLEIAPGSADGHEQYAHYLDGVGRREQGLREHEWAQQLDPDTDHIPTFNLSPLERVQRKRAYMATHTVDQGDSWELGHLSYAAGLYKDAVDNWTSVLSHYGWTEMADRVRQAYRPNNPTLAAKQLGQEIEKAAKNHWFPPGLEADFYAATDDRERAFAWLEKCYQQNDYQCLGNLNTEPWFDSLRSDPRFGDLERRAGLPQ
jgi:TolB-like protein/DNA-binding winged helix-turn-helix (wHTH) protein